MSHRGLVQRQRAAPVVRDAWREISCYFPNPNLSITITNGVSTVSSGIAWADPLDHTKQFQPFFYWWLMPFDLFACDEYSIIGNSSASYTLVMWLVDSAGTRIAKAGSPSATQFLSTQDGDIMDYYQWFNGSEFRQEAAYDIYPNAPNPMIYASGIEIEATGSASASTTLTATKILDNPYKIRMMGKYRTYVPNPDPLHSGLTVAPFDRIPLSFVATNMTFTEAVFTTVADTKDYTFFFTFTFLAEILNFGTGGIRMWPKKGWSRWYIQKVSGDPLAPVIAASGGIAADGLSYTQVFADACWNPATKILSNPVTGAVAYEMFME